MELTIGIFNINNILTSLFFKTKFNKKLIKLSTTSSNGMLVYERRIPSLYYSIFTRLPGNH